MPVVETVIQIDARNRDTVFAAEVIAETVSHADAGIAVGDENVGIGILHAVGSDAEHEFVVERQRTVLRGRRGGNATAKRSQQHTDRKARNRSDFTPSHDFPLLLGPINETRNITDRWLSAIENFAIRRISDWRARINARPDLHLFWLCDRRFHRDRWPNPRHPPGTDSAGGVQSLTVQQSDRAAAVAPSAVF